MELEQFIKETEEELREKIKKEHSNYNDWCKYEQVTCELYHSFFVGKFRELYNKMRTKNVI